METATPSAIFPVLNTSASLMLKNPLPPKEQHFFLLETLEWHSKEKAIYVRHSSNLNLTLLQIRDSYKLELRFHVCILKYPMVYSWYRVSNFLALLKSQPVSEQETILNSFLRIKFKINTFSNMDNAHHKHYMYALKC